MDRQNYLRRLRARTEHIEGALTRALGSEIEAKARLDALRQHADRIEGSSDDGWEDARADVERTMKDLHDELHVEETLHEVADAVRDGAVELFRDDSPDVLARFRKKSD